MNVLFIGNFYPEALLKSLLSESKGRIVFSNHIFEKNVIKGISGRENVNVTAVSVPNVGSFPGKNKKLFTRGENYKEEGVQIQTVGFLNLWPVFVVCRRRALQRLLVKILRRSAGERIHIILSAPEYYAQAALQNSIRLTGADVFTTVLLPDIPSIMNDNLPYKGLRRWMKHKLTVRSMEMLQTWDQYILLTPTMTDFLPGGCRTMIMEGIVSDNGGECGVGSFTEAPSVIAYTGVVDRRYGVGLLVDAFILCGNPDSELWIAGSGPMADELKRISGENPQIKYFGLVSPMKAREIQSRARVLVNPRTSEGRYTRYSFPSKTMEYLLSGRLCVANMLPGMPEEYRPFLIVPETETVEGLASALRRSLEMPVEEAILFGERGRNYVLHNKNADIQGGRILSFI